MFLEMHVDRLFSSGIGSFGKTPRQKKSTNEKRIFRSSCRSM